jgi:regulator of protease activity HflC (stomatin/prohibitin superfamily)
MTKDESVATKFVAKLGIGAILVLFLCMWGCNAVEKEYDIWAQRKVGEAEYARAETNRQIKTLEAKAALESAKFLADAEIVRAHGVAQANQIIGDSLKGNEGYLRYLWIQSLENKNKEVIYVPTEANLPILEAGRLK